MSLGIGHLKMYVILCFKTKPEIVKLQWMQCSKKTLIIIFQLLKLWKSLENQLKRTVVLLEETDPYLNATGMEG